MNTLDFSPLFRSTIGFDHLSRLLEPGFGEQNLSWPPYNIVKVDDDNYRITMAVAGFTEDDLDITAQEDQLVVTGRIAQKAEGDDTVYLHHGIAERAFERRFRLADHIRVTDANLENGLLTVLLVREIPEAMKPRKIDIIQGKLLGKKAKAA